MITFVSVFVSVLTWTVPMRMLVFMQMLMGMNVRVGMKVADTSSVFVFMLVPVLVAVGVQMPVLMITLHFVDLPLRITAGLAQDT